MRRHSPAHMQAVQLAMDRKDRERELVSVALPELVPRVISGKTPLPELPPADDQVALGFTRLPVGSSLELVHRALLCAVLCCCRRPGGPGLHAAAGGLIS